MSPPNVTLMPNHVKSTPKLVPIIDDEKSEDLSNDALFGSDVEEDEELVGDIEASLEKDVIPNKEKEISENINSRNNEQPIIQQEKKIPVVLVDIVPQQNGASGLVPEIPRSNPGPNPSNSFDESESSDSEDSSSSTSDSSESSEEDDKENSK